jgi:cysteine desulfurase
VPRIYLDHNATTALLPEVFEAMAPYLSGAPGNASSLHQEGRLARRAVESARECIAGLLDASPRQMIFTSGGTEANNLAIFGLAGLTPERVAVGTTEHPSVQGCFDTLKARMFQVEPIPVDRCGIVALERYEAVLDTKPRLVSVMLANNETGSLQPIAQLAAAARARGALFHSDAVQAVGKMAVSFRSLGVTSLSMSAHKFHGPAGVGALLVEAPNVIQPLVVGGHQESGRRAGTESVAAIVGMAKALELAVERLGATQEQVRRLADQFILGLQEHAAPVVLNGSERRLAGTINLQFPGIDARAAVIALDLEGLACSTGSACSSGAALASPALLAMGLNETAARSSIRFSLGQLTSESEIVTAIELISRVVGTLRRIPVSARI